MKKLVCWQTAFGTCIFFLSSIATTVGPSNLSIIDTSNGLINSLINATSHEVELCAKTFRTPPNNPNSLGISTASGLVHVYTFDDTTTAFSTPCFYQNPTNNRFASLSFYNDTTGQYLVALAPDDNSVYILTVTTPGTQMIVTGSVNYGSYTATSCAWHDNGLSLDIIIGCNERSMVTTMVDRATKTITAVTTTSIPAPAVAVDTCFNDIAVGLEPQASESARLLMGYIANNGTYDYFVTNTSFQTGLDEITAVSWGCSCGCTTLPYVAVGGSIAVPAYNGAQIYAWDPLALSLTLINTTTDVGEYVSDLSCSYDGTDLYVGIGLGTQFVANMYKLNTQSSEPTFQNQTALVRNYGKKYITWGCCGTHGNKFLVSLIKTSQTIDIYEYTSTSTPGTLASLISQSFDNAIVDMALYYPDYISGQPGDHIYIALSLDTTDTSPSSSVQIWHFDGTSTTSPSFTQLGEQNFPNYVVQNVAWWVDSNGGHYDPTRQYLATAGYNDAVNNNLTMWNIQNSGTIFNPVAQTTMPTAYDYLTWGIDPAAQYLVLLGNPALYSYGLDIYKIDINTKNFIGFNEQTFPNLGIASIFSGAQQEYIGFADFSASNTTGVINSYSLSESLSDTSKIELLPINTVSTAQYIPVALHMCNNGTNDLLLAGLANNQDQGTYTVAIYNPLDLTRTVSAMLTSAVNSVGWQCNGSSNFLAVNYGEVGESPINPFAYSKGYIYLLETVPTVTLNPIIPVPSNSPY